MTSGRRLIIALFVLSLPLVTPRIRASDEIEYFSYLPSLFFDRDLEFGNEYQYFYDQNPGGLALFKGTFLDKREPETGRHINFGPIGSAVLWSPFYLLAHLGVLAARSLGASVAANGLSAPYVAAVCYASALYGFLGFLLMHAALRRRGRIPEPAAGWAPAALWYGTPALYYMTLAPGFSHAPSLFAVSLLVWLWLRARERDSLADWVLVGAAGGLAGLIREQDALFLIVPALGLVVDAWRRRDWGRALGRLGVLAVASAAVFLPQLLVYKALTGHFRPSRMVSAKLEYTSPHFLEVLFSAGHGLFVWSPLLLVAMVGLGLSALRRRDLVATLLGLGLLAQIWINGALSTWTQGGAFGSRRFIAATPVFVWGLASLLAEVLPLAGRRVTAAVLCLFAWWNVSLMVQFGLRLMDRQRLEWPRVAVNQVVEVPPRLARVAYLFITDRERLAREGLPGP